MDKFNTAEFQRRLLAWFQAQQRALPWRKPFGETRDPYAVVVSEVMLQQTQVSTVLPYYRAWMEKFPNWEALAQAPTDRVLKAWEGLGYYRRARFLHQIAQRVVSQYGGRLPATLHELQKLPGIGPYSARSIASLAFDLPAACVDGNIVRVISRLLRLDTLHKSSSAAQKKLQPLADQLLNHHHPGAHNEALMELGATVCTKATPACQLCPLTTLCQAHLYGVTDSLPRLQAKRLETKQVKRVWVWHQHRLLLHQGQTATGQLHGLWELPTPEALGIKRLPRKEALRRVRNITKYKITEVIYKINKTDNLLKKIESQKENTALRWATRSQLAQLPLSGPHAQWIEELLGRLGS